MFAAGTVTVFALDVGQVLQLRIQRIPIPVGELGGERPTNLFCDVIEAAIDGIGVGVVADGVAGDTGLAIVTKEPINAFREDFGVAGGLPRVPFIGSDSAAAVAEF